MKGKELWEPEGKIGGKGPRETNVKNVRSGKARRNDEDSGLSNFKHEKGVVVRWNEEENQKSNVEEE